MTDDVRTKPTIETVLERINDFGNKCDNRITGLQQQVANIGQRASNLQQQLTNFEQKVEEGFNSIDIQPDCIGGVAHTRRGEM